MWMGGANLIELESSIRYREPSSFVLEKILAFCGAGCVHSIKTEVPQFLHFPAAATSSSSRATTTCVPTMAVMPMVRVGKKIVYLFMNFCTTLNFYGTQNGDFCARVPRRFAAWIVRKSPAFGCHLVNCFRVIFVDRKSTAKVSGSW